MGNRHVKLAERALDGVHDWQGEEGSTDATQIAAALGALTQATLALGNEQFTANLIAFYADGANGPVPGVDYNALAGQIVARLHPNTKIGAKS